MRLLAKSCRSLSAVLCSLSALPLAPRQGFSPPYVMGSVVEAATTPLNGFNTGFMICGVIMLMGGLIGMALIRPERDALRWTKPIAVAAADPA